MRTVLIIALTGCATEPLTPPTGHAVDYAVTSELTPTTAGQVRDLGLDLAGDAAVDNVLGMVMSDLAMRDLDPGDETGLLIERGALQLTATLQYAQSSDPSDSIAFSTSLTQEPLLGYHTEPPMYVGPGSLTVAIGFFGDVVGLELVDAQVRIDHADDTRLTGVIAGGVRSADLEPLLAPPLVRRLNELVASECTRNRSDLNCGCPDTTREYDARYWIQLFDIPPHDCEITTSEIMNNPLTKALITPDMTLGGEQLLSFGFGFEAAAN